MISLKLNHQSRHLFYDTTLVTEVKEGQRCLVIPHESPFYVECGGQVSDQGFIEIDHTTAAISGLQKIDNAIAFSVVAPTNLKVEDYITQKVNEELRLNAMKNHTATHLLQAALIELLGKQIKQAGSLVAPDYLRFDFTYHEQVTPEQIVAIENIVNRKIEENITLDIQQTTYKDAVSKGVIAFFGDKYNPDKVRVVADSRIFC